MKLPDLEQDKTGSGVKAFVCVCVGGGGDNGGFIYQGDFLG